MPNSETPDVVALFWPPGAKMQAMQTWGENVMKDTRTTRTEIKVAWALSFAFNDKDARAWPTHETLAKSVGLSAEAVRLGIRGLVRNGHLLRLREKVLGKEMVVSRPTLNSGVVNRQPPRARRGGKPSTAPLVKGQPVGVVDPQPPCILDLSLNDPECVEGFIQGEGTEEFQDQEDPEMEDWDTLPP